MFEKVKLFFFPDFEPTGCGLQRRQLHPLNQLAGVNAIKLVKFVNDAKDK
jgi:hypothetical protein